MGRSKKTTKLRVTGLCEGNSPVTGEFPAQSPVTRKMFPFDDVIMQAITTGQPPPMVTIFDDNFVWQEHLRMNDLRNGKS